MNTKFIKYSVDYVGIWVEMYTSSWASKWLKDEWTSGKVLSVSGISIDLLMLKC